MHASLDGWACFYAYHADLGSDGARPSATFQMAGAHLTLTD
jgi:hypothetical protein